MTSAVGVASRFLTELRQLAAITSPPTTGRYVYQIIRALPMILTSRTLAPADRAMSDASVTCTVSGVTVRLPPGFFPGAREMYARRVYFPGADLPFGSESHVVDLGANFGLFTGLAIAAGASVLAVEAQQGMASKIREIAAANHGADRVRIVHGMVGPTSGLAGQGKAGLGSHEGAPPAPFPLSQLLDEAEFDTVDFLKVDIEGSEFSLAAEPHWLSRVRRFAMEVHSNSGNPAVLEQVFRSAGFTLECRDPELRIVSTLGESDGYLYGWRS